MSKYLINAFLVDGSAATEPPNDPIQGKTAPKDISIRVPTNHLSTVKCSLSSGSNILLRLPCVPKTAIDLIPAAALVE